MKNYKVGTFVSEIVKRNKTAICDRHVLTYHGFYSKEWDGCIEYTVQAENELAAKDVARSRRLEFERGLAAAEAHNFGKDS